MRSTKLLVLLIIASLLLIALPACEEAEEDEPSADEWIVRGKKLLGEGDGTGAYLAFQSALEEDNDNLQAKYGVVLADVLQFGATIDLVLGLLFAKEETLPAEETAALCQKLDQCDVLADTDTTYEECIASGNFNLDQESIDCVIGAPSCEIVYDRCLGLMLPPNDELCRQACVRFDECGMMADSEWDLAMCADACPRLYVSGELQCFLTFDDCAYASETCFPTYGDSIQTILEDFWFQISQEMVNNLYGIWAHPDDFRFDIEKFNFTFFDLIFQPSLAGVHDYADSFFFAAMYSFMEVIFDAALGLDLNFNPLLLQTVDFDFDLNISLEDFSAEDVETIIELLGWADDVIDLILNDPTHPTFLTLRDEEGVDRIRQMGQQIGGIFGSLAMVIDEVNRETDEQWDDAIRYVDENENLVWDETESLLVPGVTEMEYDLAWAVRNLLVALKVDFVDGYPFNIESLAPMFDYFDLSFVNVIIEIMDLAGLDSVDLGAPFRNPDEAGLRPLLSDLREIISIAILVLSDLDL